MPEILFTPMIFRARSVMGRRRTPEDIYLRKIVPIEIARVEMDDAPIVAELGRAGHLRDLDGTLFVPILPPSSWNASRVVSLADVRALASDGDVLEASEGRRNIGSFASSGLPNAANVALDPGSEILECGDREIRTDIAEYEERAFVRVREGYGDILCVGESLYRKVKDIAPVLTVVASDHQDGLLSTGVEAAWEGRIHNYDRTSDRLVFSLFDQYHFGSCFDHYLRYEGWGEIGSSDVAGAERFFLETLPTNMVTMKTSFEKLLKNIDPLECDFRVLDMIHEYRRDHRILWESEKEYDHCEILAVVALNADAIFSFGESWGLRDDICNRARGISRMARMVSASVAPYLRHKEKLGAPGPEAEGSDPMDEEAISFGM
jgi:hypothetical protein